MDIMNKKYEKLNDEFRNELENDLQIAIVEQCQKEEMEEQLNLSGADHQKVTDPSGENMTIK